MTLPGGGGPMPLRWSWAQRFRLLRLRWRYERHWRFAHHPLCDRFRRDVLRLGDWRLCRSCCLVWAGLSAIVAVGILPGWRLDGVMLTALWTVVLAFSWPSLYACLPRSVRDGLRFGAGVGLGGLLILVAVSWPGTAAFGALAGLAALMAIHHWLYTPIRRRRLARACDGCLSLGVVEAGRIGCPGFARQAADVLRFEEEASKLIVP